MSKHHGLADCAVENTRRFRVQFSGDSRRAEYGHRLYTPLVSMTHFWKTRDGQWRKGVVALLAMLLVSAVYDFIREGWGSLSGIQYLLFAASLVALPPAEDAPKEPRWHWRLLGSPRYFIGAVAYVAAGGILVYRIVRDIWHG